LFQKRHIKKFTDPELVVRYKQTSDKMFVGELYERYTRFVFLVCMKYLKNEDKAKDAVMQIFEKLMQDLLKHNVSNFKPWLHTVTRNYCLIQIRNDKPQHDFVKEFKKDHENYVESGNNLYLDSERDKESQLQDLEQALESLSKEQRLCIELFYLKEKCYAEVSEITGYNIKKVKSYLQNGKRNLKNILTSKHEQQPT